MKLATKEDAVAAALEKERAKVRELKHRATVLATALEQAQKPRKRLKLSPPRQKHRTGYTRVIIPDTHGSAIDRRAVAAFLADLKMLDPKEIVMLGDHVDCGGFLAQHHVLGFVAQAAYSYADDIAMANDFLDAVQAAAPNAVIHYIEGNHERRIETWAVTQTLRHQKDCEMLRRAFAPEFLLHLKDRGIMYYRQAESYHGIRTQGTIKLGKCFFWHGTSTAKHAASVNLAQFGGNVVYGHTHREDHSSLRPVGQGDIAAWNPGCLCVQQPLWCHTRPTNWTTGYGMQTVAANGDFLHVNIRIVDGRSLLLPLLNRNVQSTSL